MPHLLDEVRGNLAILDLKPGASWQQVKDRYRFLAKVWHPDRFGSDQRARSRAERQFQAVNAAYQWLAGHRSVVEFFSESSQPEGANPAPGERRPGTASGEPSQEPEEPPAPARSATEPKRRVDESTVEKFLWGVVATFTLIAITVFVVSGSLSNLLRQLDSESSAIESAPGAVSPSSAPPKTSDGVSGAHAVRYVTASRLYVRSEPSQEAPVVSVLERGSRVRVEPGTGPWLRVVRADGTQVGWLHGDYLTDRGPTAASPAATDDRDRAEEVDMAKEFAATVRAHGSMDSQLATAPTESAENPSTDDFELIRGAWKPKNPDPGGLREEFASSSGSGSDLERWSGAVDGAVPHDLPRVTIRLDEDLEAERRVGAAVYWRQAGSCTYALELLQRYGAWIRTSQIAESPECPPYGEIWFMIGESEMTAIWHRLDGTQWFTSRLELD